MGNKKSTSKTNETAEDVVEADVCSVDDLKDGEMREFPLGNTKILLVKECGQYCAIGNKCSHYGAPLIKGVACNGRVRCPWHGACFNIKTGDIEDFPGLDSIPKYNVRVKNGKVKVSATEASLQAAKRTKAMTCPDSNDSRVYLIVGGGGAAITCAETLRQEGFCGKIIMATKESNYPYDRPKLSKMLDSKAEALYLRSPDSYKQYGIEVWLNNEVISISAKENGGVATFFDTDAIHFDKVLIATGGAPRILNVKGNDLKNIYRLRTSEDGNKISENSKGKSVVIIGNSFIGMEVAAYLSGKAASITVVGQSEIPFQKILGETIGNAFKKLHQEKGTVFIGGTSAEEFVGENGVLTAVKLNNGTELKADVCVVAVGVVPATECLHSSGVELTERGTVKVDKYLCTNKPSVYAAGDITEFPLCCADNTMVNIGHWQMACTQGRIAALNMLGRHEQLQSVPFFWTQQFGKSLRYTGYGAKFDDIVIHGDPNELKFTAYYTKENQVVAVASMNQDPICAQAAEMMSAGKCITKDEIKGDPHCWLPRLHSKEN